MFLLQALGSNGSGQLGIGHKEDVSTPQPVILPPTTADEHPSRIVAGGNHSLLLLSSGDLYWSGDASTGACGRVPENKTEELTPEFRLIDLSPLPEGTKVRLAAATWEASVVVVTKNSNSDEEVTTDRVFSFGSGTKGELGLGPSTLCALEATLIRDFPPPGTQIIDLAACMSHVVAVLSNGEAWGWGGGRKGQLGEPAVGVMHSPRRIEGAGLNFKVTKAVCGREFTCLFGSPEAGEMVVLGSDKWGVRSQAPGSVAGWKEVGAGWGNVFVLKEDGALLSWGRDDHGQLAREDLGRVKHIAVGSEHALALTDDGDLEAWGWGEHGNCGPIQDRPGERGERNCLASSKAISNEPGMGIAMIGAGCATSWVAVRKTS